MPNVEELIAKVTEWLHKSGLALGELARGNPEKVEQAVDLAISRVPALTALRFVPGGRKLARSVVQSAIERLPKSTPPPSSTST